MSLSPSSNSLENLFRLNMSARSTLVSLFSLEDNQSQQWATLWAQFESQTALSAQLIALKSESAVVHFDPTEHLQIAYASHLNAVKFNIKLDTQKARMYVQRALCGFLTCHGPIFSCTSSSELSPVSPAEQQWAGIPEIYPKVEKGQLWDTIVAAYLLAGGIDQSAMSFLSAAEFFEKALTVAKNSGVLAHILTPVCESELENNSKYCKVQPTQPIDITPQYQPQPQPLIQPFIQPLIQEYLAPVLPPMIEPLLTDTNSNSSRSTATDMDEIKSDQPSTTTRQSIKIKRSRDMNKPFQCNMCNRSYSHLSSLKTHMIMHSDAAYVCNVCNKKFTHQKRLDNHMKRHLGVKPFACDRCPRSFADKCSLTRHYRRHTKEKPFKCELCPERFIDSDGLIAHRRRNHTNERPYSCPHCELTFITNSDLRSHLTVHTDARPHQCGFCSARFKRRGDCTKHERTKHNPE